MKRNNPDILNAIVESLSKGNGRVMTCKQVGITYDQFLEWIDPNHKTQYVPEFHERVKKAEGTGSIRIKEICESVIMKAATDNDKPTWQAAAWMLERKFRNEYALKSEIDHTTKGDKIQQTVIVQDEETIRAINELKAKFED